MRGLVFKFLNYEEEMTLLTLSLFLPVRLGNGEDIKTLDKQDVYFFIEFKFQEGN